MSINGFSSGEKHRLVVMFTRDFAPSCRQDLLMLLRKRGPSTEGVFRKTCNNKNMRDIREQLNSGVEVELEAQPVLLLVGLLKVGLHQQGHHVALSVSQ